MLGRLLGRESRAMTYQQAWASGDWPSANSWSGQRITQVQSLQISTVYACVRLYTDTISTLPVGAFQRDAGTRRPFFPRPAWMDYPYPNVPWSSHVQQGLVSLLLNGNWYTRIFRNTLGEPVALLVLNPQQVEPQQRADGQVVYTFDGGRSVIDAADMIHITELALPGEVKGVSRIDQVRQELGLAQALTEFSSKFFGNGTSVSGVIETPAAVTADQARQVKDAFESTHRGAGKAHGVAVIGGGGRFVKTSTAPDEAQMLESKAQSVEAIARVFRVPPQKIGVTTPGAMSYASVEQMNMAWSIDSVRPYVEKIETAYSRLLPGGAFVRLNMDALLRGDTTSRYAAYSQALDSGWAAINDVRRLEDMTPIEGGDQLRVPLENINLTAANVVETEKKTLMAARLINVGFDPAAVLSVLDLPPIEHTGIPSVLLQPVDEADPANASTGGQANA